MKKYKLLFLLTFALVFCALFCVSASAATDDGTGIFVGGVLVTDANSHDILGDGSAKYDPNTYTLTIKNYDAEGVVRTDDSGEASDVALSVYVGVGKTAITVIIEGDCFFSGGVVNMAGKVEVKNASITFGHSAPTFLYARNGALDIVNSKITMEGVNFLSPIFSSTEMGMGFFASQIGVKDSSFTLKPKNCEAYNLNRLDALFCSADNSSFQNCDFRISTPFPVFRTLFQAYTNALIFTDCDFDLSGQMYCFLASGNTGGMENVSGENLGAVLLSNCEIEVENTYYLAGGKKLQIHDSQIKADLYRGGFIMSSSGEKDRYIFKNSRIELSALSLEDMEKHIWRPYWNVMPQSEKENYNGFSAFVLASRENELKNPVTTFGIFAQNGVSYFDQTRLRVRGFDFGYFACGKTLAQCLEKTYLDLRANRAAFVIFSVFADALQNEAEADYGKSELKELSLPEGTDINAIGTAVYGFVKKGETLRFTKEKAFENLEEALSSLEGIQTKVEILTEGAMHPRNVWIVAGCGAIVLGFALTYFFAIRSKTKKD